MNFEILLCTKQAPSPIQNWTVWTGNNRRYSENNSTLFGPNDARRHYCQREEAVGLNMKWKRRPTAAVVQRHMDCCYYEKCVRNTGCKHRCVSAHLLFASPRLAMSICHHRTADASILIKLYIFWFSLKSEVKMGWNRSSLVKVWQTAVQPSVG